MRKRGENLRKTEIQLADGKIYIFRAIPLSPSTMPIICPLLSEDSDKAQIFTALVAAARLSLSYDQSEDVVIELMENGFIPLVDTEDEHSGLYKKIMSAMMASLGKKSAD